MKVDKLTVEVDAVITDEQYKEALALVHEANERIDEVLLENESLRDMVRYIWDMHLYSKTNPTAYGWTSVMEEASRLGIELEYPS